MKNKMFFLALMLMLICKVNAQYKAVIIPVRFEFMSADNQYRLATLSKYNLQKSGLQAFYTNEAVPNEYNDRCGLLYFDIIKDSGLFTTKLAVAFKDCYGKIVYQSPFGKSKEKEFQAAYTEALNDAFGQAKFSFQTKEVETTSNVEKEAVKEVAVKTAENVSQNSELWFAQPINNGFQLVDNTPKVVMKIFRTMQKDVFLAQKNGLQGILTKQKDNWYFEYYEQDKLKSEVVNIKF